MRLRTAIKSDLILAKTFARFLPLVARARARGGSTIVDAVEDHARRRPSHAALVFEERTLSYRDLDAEANRVARWALDQGLAQGDVVALLMENRPEFVACWLGLAKLGVVTALINTNLTGRPLAHSLAISGARHLILDAALAPQFEGASEELETPLEVWTSGASETTARDLDDDLARRAGDALPPESRPTVRTEDNLFYIYTSGTTGLPKAANFSHGRFLLLAAGGTAFPGLQASDRMYIVLPLYHSAGGAMAMGATLLVGATAVLARKFSATRFWADAARHRVTAFQYIGELCRYLVNSPRHPDERKHRLRYCIGNGLRPEVWPEFQRRFAIPQVYEFYGATEGNVSFVNLDGKVGSIGRMPGWMQRAAGVHLVRFDVEKEDVVRGPDGFCIDCAVGEPGEAIGRITETVRFEGYSDAAASEKKILRDVFQKGDAYFRTGDLLKRDAEGYFYFVDRIGDTFRWKGENVSTGEVAEVISGVRGVKEANVYGVEVAGTDGRAGMASLVVDDDFDLEDFHAEAARALPAYARPLFLRMLPEIEITGTFKHRKVDSVAEGFDPSRVSDALYFLDATSGGYVPLDAALHDRILAGDVRL